MTKKSKETLASGRILHQHRLLCFTLTLVFAFAMTASGGFEEHTRAGTSRASTNPTKAAKGGTGVSPVNHAQDARTTAESRFTKLDGARIHYVNYGKGGDALVLIHGWTCNLDNWRDQMPDFAKRNRVIAIDLPGHGQSDKPQITYSMDLFARAVEAVMRDAKVKRAVLVGHSMGTPIARQFYRKYPEKTIAIVIVDGPLRPFGDKALMDRLIAGFRGPNYREAGNQMLAGLSGPNLSAEARERIKASFLNTPQHVLVSAMEGMADASIWGDDKINVPVLAIMAKNPFYGANIEELFRGLAPRLDFQMWDGVGHFIMMEKPKEFNDAVLAFLDKNKLLKK
jgi:pimeloyl-ACP methyl ester carboxylesterase